MQLLESGIQVSLTENQESRKPRNPESSAWIRNPRLSLITFKGWARSNLLLERKSNQGLPDGLSTRPHCLFVTGKVLQSSETGNTED